MSRHAAPGPIAARVAHLTPTTKAVALAAAGVLALGTLGVATNAAFTDSGTTVAALSAGTLDLTIEGSARPVAAPYDLAFPAGFEPGETFTRTVTLENTGTIDSVVSLATVVTGDDPTLADEVDVTITSGSTTLYTGPLDEAAFTKAALDAGDDLTVEVAGVVASDLSNTFQGATATVTLTFTASQASLV